MSIDPQWYKDAIIYELHVRAFHDSDGDGFGDFSGLTQRLDYLQDLGVTALWLLPFYPSPLRDDGYDIADYTDIHANYGTLADFRKFLDEAHRRGLRVITELVLNHTSDQHPWFQRARRAAVGSPERDFYVWAEAVADCEPPGRYGDARIIFPDFEQSNWTWDPLAKAYYWHRFYSHQPDLNFDSPHVKEALLPIVDFWLGMGVDGLRLDAVPYLFEREGTHCENLPETYGFLRELRSHIDRNFEGRMLLAEANQWPEDAVAYLGEGDLCHMAFHFPLMPRLFMALRTEDRFPVVDILEQTPDLPSNCQWALFLRNHDELTLEMVTHDERDFMNRAYAHDPQARINLGIRRRLAPLLGNDRRRIELMNALLFSLPGTPVVYYGDEIGMGDNVYLGDRDSVRTPMQWSSDRNAGFSRANPQRLFLPTVIDPSFHFEAINVDAQEDNPHSLLAWMKRLIALRKRYRSLGRGDLTFLRIENQHILAFMRSLESEQILVVTNLSRYPQPFTFDPGPLAGLVPIELFGRVHFPPFEDQPYRLTLGPHSFFWFTLESPQPESAIRRDTSAGEIAVLEITHEWQSLFEPANWRLLDQVLQDFVIRRPAGRKYQEIRRTEVADVLPFGDVYFVQLKVEPVEGAAETLMFPLAFSDEGAAVAPEVQPDSAVARIVGRSTGLLYDATKSQDFCARLLQFIGSGASMAGSSGQIVATNAETSGTIPHGRQVTPRPLPAAQGNTSIVFDESLILKLFRRIDGGVHPDLEIGRFLGERTGFQHAPRVVASLEYRRGRNEPMTIGILHEFIEHAVDGWKHSLEELNDFYGRVTGEADLSPPELPSGSLLTPIHAVVSKQFKSLIGQSLKDAQLIGRRTAEMHVALASVRDDRDFSPEPLSTLEQRSLYQSLRNQSGRTFRAVRSAIADVPEPMQRQLQTLLNAEHELHSRFRKILARRITAQLTRVHCDYSLGQLLWSEGDLWVIDFEGDPDRTLSVRRQRLSPLADVVTLLWSLQYATVAAMDDSRHGNSESLAGWGRLWHRCVAAELLSSYFDAASQASFLPRNADERQILFDCLYLDRGLQDLGHRVRHFRFEGVAGIAATLSGLLPIIAKESSDVGADAN